MGICLDTGREHKQTKSKKANTAAQEVDDPGAEWKGGGDGDQSQLGIQQSPSGPKNMHLQNAGKIKFDTPKVPVIFVLGGPGSGKVTHCDTLMQEKRGVTHINMMDLLQQFAIGNDMQDFSQLSSETVTEVLMLEMKMAPAAKAYLISGFPRSMRDVVEYTEKIQMVNGVVLISWRQSVLQKQIDYGVKLGHVVLSLAKMELENFFKNVMPVADYFDQSDMLIAVNGERAPNEVYKDFRSAVLEILGAQENQEALLNGVAGMGRGVNEIPGSIVSVETAPSQQKNIPASITQTPNMMIHPNSLMGQNVNDNPPQTVYNKPASFSPIIWVIGGPGSNKATLCLKAIGINPGWGHFSVGRLLRSIAESDPKANTEEFSIKEAISAGEMAPKRSIDKIFDTQLMLLSEKRGILIDGFPRDMHQVKEFEERYHQKPPIVLLDCSKLQLGRGRLDDTVSSFRRRLELFRELTLPMLKQMDGEGRLTIVDGDTDSPSVQREFERVIREKIQAIQNEKQANGKNVNIRTSSNSNKDAYIQDLEEVPGAVPTISRHVSLVNGHLKGSSNLSNSENEPKNQSLQNGNVINRRPNFRKMLDEADEYPIDSYM